MRCIRRRTPWVREVAVCTKTSHGQMPIGVVHARPMERRPCALKNSPHGRFGYAIRLWSVVGRSMVSIAQFPGRLRQFRRIIRPKVFNFVIRSEEVLHGCFDRFGILGQSSQSNLNTCRGLQVRTCLLFVIGRVYQSSNGPPRLCRQTSLVLATA